MCFTCACMDVTIQLELCFQEEAQIVANATCRVGSQQFLSQIANYLFPYFYCDPYVYLFLTVISLVLVLITMSYKLWLEVLINSLNFPVRQLVAYRITTSLKHTAH